MTTIKVGSKDAYGFHPNGDIVDPDAIDAFIGTKYAQKPIAPSDLPSYLGQSALNTTYAAQAAVTANTTNIAANTAAINSLFLNVKNAPYNAKGDGTTDDSVAIQAAWDATSTNGGAVYFPPGVYRAKNLQIRSNLFIMGAGVGATTIKLLDGANTHLITTPNFSTLTGTNSTAGEHHFRIDSLTLDGNRTNQTAASNVLNLYASCYRVHHVEILNAYTDNVYSEWSSNGGGDMEAHWSDFKIIGHGRHGLNWNGPHDSVFTQGEVVSANFTPGYSDTGIWCQGNSGGEVFIGVHVWGYHARGWVQDHSCTATACQSEGARNVGLLVRAAHVRWAGKVFGTADYHTNELGVQIGDTTFTGMVGSALDIDIHNFGPTSYPLKWVSTAGQNRITGRWWKGTATTLYTGTPDPKDDIEMVCADVPASTIYSVGHQATYTAYSGSWRWVGSGSTMFNITASGNRIELVNQANLRGYKDLFTTPTLNLYSGSGGIQSGTSQGVGSTEYSGTGAPAITGALGDRYWRTDTPSTTNQRLYICTTAGAGGVAVWTPIL